MALPTSGTYNFQSIEVELLIREAFENIGVFGEFVESQKLDSARRSINFLLLEWMSKSVNLWTLQYYYMTLNTSQAIYPLLNKLSDVVQINLRTSTRQLNGTPLASSGVATDAFDGNPTTHCNAGVNGWISYDYGAAVTQQINFVGFTPFANITLTDTAEAAILISQDGVTWTGLQAIPAETYLAGQTYWFDIIAAKQARFYRMQVNGGLTLDLIELYFNNNIFDMPISEVSRYEYFTYPNKQLQGRPSVYYVDRQIDPILYIWPVPDPNYNCLQISYKEMMQDAGAYANNTLQIPSRFYPALTLGLSWKLAIKFKPEAAAQFKAEYEQAFTIATTEDSENVAISIRGDTTYDYWR